MGRAGFHSPLTGRRPSKLMLNQQKSLALGKT